MNDTSEPRLVPPRQHNLQDALVLAMEAVAQQSGEQLEWLGARQSQGRWTLSVLGDVLTVDMDKGVVCSSDGHRCGAWWEILTLHYLGVSKRPTEESPSICFADLPGGRAYAAVYQKRVIDRLCKTAGRDEQTLIKAGRLLGVEPLSQENLTLDFQVYPRVKLRLIWYRGDEELSPSGVLLLAKSIESFFCIEDIVVLSERLVSRLSGGHF